MTMNDKFSDEIDGIKAGMRIKVATGRAYEITGRWFTYPGMAPVISGLPLDAKGNIRRPNRPSMRNLTRAEMVEIV
jgi:hypothetical protein